MDSGFLFLKEIDSSKRGCFLSRQIVGIPNWKRTLDDWNRSESGENGRVNSQVDTNKKP